MDTSLKSFAVSLIRSRIIDVTPYVTKRENVWTLTKDIGGLKEGATFQGDLEVYDRIATGLVEQFHSGGLRAVA